MRRSVPHRLALAHLWFSRLLAIARPRLGEAIRLRCLVAIAMLEPDLPVSRSRAESVGLDAADNAKNS